MSGAGSVEIHYRRVPDSLQIFRQRVVVERSDVIVTLSEPIRMDIPARVDGRIMLEDGSVVVWFTFPDAWHDIGRFHRSDGTFSGIYANILTPPTLDGPVWHTTDLCLDVWWPAGGTAQLLDEDEFDAAHAAGHIDDATACRAREEADRVMMLAESGRWPPQVVDEWTLARSLVRLGDR